MCVLLSLSYHPQTRAHGPCEQQYWQPAQSQTQATAMAIVRRLNSACQELRRGLTAKVMVCSQCDKEHETLQLPSQQKPRAKTPKATQPYDDNLRQTQMVNMMLSPGMYQHSSKNIQMPRAYQLHKPAAMHAQQCTCCTLTQATALTATPACACCTDCPWL
jgi:hypothetical protein